MIVENLNFYLVNDKFIKEAKGHLTLGIFKSSLETWIRISGEQKEM